MKLVTSLLGSNQRSLFVQSWTIVSKACRYSKYDLIMSEVVVSQIHLQKKVRSKNVSLAAVLADSIGSDGGNRGMDPSCSQK